MILVEGDLFSFGGSIGHGVNAMGYMDSGIAVEFKKRFPVMFREYKSKCVSGELTSGELYVYEDGERFIYNLVSQEKTGANARLDYLALSAAKALNHASAHSIKTIALPKIGSGIGGLEWSDVEFTLNQVERNSDSYFTVYEPPQASS